MLKQFYYWDCCNQELVNINKAKSLNLNSYRNFEKCLRLFIIKDQLLLAKIYLRLGQNCQ